MTLVAAAQVFTGTQAPNTYSEFVVTFGSAVTNVSFVVPGTSSAYSWLLIKKGTAPTDTQYDFSSRVNGQTNALHLEAPEAGAGTYYIRVRTPGTSQPHTFTLTVQTNQSNLRSAERPVTKPMPSLVRGAALNAAWQYFRVELSSNTMWCVTVDTTNQASPDLYVQRGQLPSTGSFLKDSRGQTNDLVTLTQTEGTPGAYYIGVLGTGGPGGGVPFTLKAERIVPIALDWDPGTAHHGTKTYTNFIGTAGDYYFRVLTKNSALSAWRVALRLFNTNEANLYLSKGVIPTPTSCLYKFERTGSKGIVLALNSHFQPNEEWFILVRAKTRAEWSLLSGEPYVLNLGTIAADGSSGSPQVEIGPEGLHFFRASAPPDMLAWRLYLNGATNVIYVKTNRVPLPYMAISSPAFTGAYEDARAGQMLVVPPYLNVGSYFVGVLGAPGTPITLDSRHQEIIDLPYGESASRHVTGYPYQTYRVTLPPNEIAWQIDLPATNGNPNLAVRRNTVPNEKNNDAISELTGTVPDNITLVPPTLSDGSFYITVYSTNVVSTNNYRYTLNSGRAHITDIDYTTSIVNDDPTRVGWKFYRVTDLDRQRSSLGWDILLTNFAPGTKIAIRRNAAPSLWVIRNPNPLTVKQYDVLSTAEFLQCPDQEADYWYIGVYNPATALGPFTLVTREIGVTTLAENQPIPVNNLLPGRWEFFRVTLAAQETEAAGHPNPILGWDVRVTDVLTGLPNIVVRRERLPTGITTGFDYLGTNWPSGQHWAAKRDWTRRAFSADGEINEEGRILAMAVGRPLVPATYYIGVMANGTNASNCKMLSRWIGPGRSIPVTDLAWENGRAEGTLTPRDAAYYRVRIPADAESWKVRLAPANGEAMMVATRNFVPTVESDERMQKPGNEHYVLFPTAMQNYLVPGTHFLTVVGEGQSPASKNRIGDGPVNFVLQSLGEMAETDLGTVGSVDIEHNFSLEGGETTGYHFHTKTTTLGFWLSLENAVGEPWMVWKGGMFLPYPGLSGDSYGSEGGDAGGAEDSPIMITVADPSADQTVIVKASGWDQDFPDASYKLRIKEIIPDEIPFDGGVYPIVNRSPEYHSFFYIDVPPGAMGLDIRLTNVTSGYPYIVMRRDGLPFEDITTGFNGDAYNSSIWPDLANLISSYDWTDRYLSSDGADEWGHVQVLGRGRPLQPGRIYICVRGDDWYSSEPISCTLVTRGIGDGFSIPINPLPFAGGSVAITNLPPREAAYFRVEVPAGALNWKVQLSCTSGEGLLAVLKDTIPNVGASITWNTTNSGGRKMQKVGDEELLLLPPKGQDRLAGGTYYLAVVSEGQGVTNSYQVGYGTSSFLLTSIGEAPPHQLGTVGTGTLEAPGSLNGGEVKLYQFTVPEGVQSLQARLESRTGNPFISLVSGSRAPDPGTGVSPAPPDSYGNEGGESPGANVKPTQIPVPNPVPGVYTIAVKARGNGDRDSQTVSNATYVLQVRADTTMDLDFDLGSASISNHPGRDWRHFKVIVPEDALGWDIRLTNVTAGAPRLVVRRDSLPSGLANTPGWSLPGTTGNWPPNNQWAPVPDWTRRSLSPIGTNEDGRILAMGLNRPLQPGVYYIGVSNIASAAANYTILSRGIGGSYAIPLLDLPFEGSVTNMSLPPREAAYFRVVVPSNAPSWKLALTGLEGTESMLSVLRGGLPNFDSVRNDGALASNGKGMQRLGNDHYVILPVTGATNIVEGTNYVAVISEGANPPAATRIGTGPSAFILTSGTLPVRQLGRVTSEDIVRSDTLQSGEVKAYQLDVPPYTKGVKILLEGVSGNPVAVAWEGDNLPDPGAQVTGSNADVYGNEGGYRPPIGHAKILTIPNPRAGKYSLAVKARPLGTTTNNAAYTLRVQELLTPQLNFSSDENSNGLSHIVANRQLQDNERAFFRVQVPQTLNGQPVLGWKLTLSQSSGLASMRVSRSVLPSDANDDYLMNFVTSSAVLAPPFLTNGTWYVEVKGTGTTEYTLVSEPLLLERPAWVMPEPGQASSTPGVESPFFGDSAIDTNGVPLPSGSQGIELPQGTMHYYAVVIPENNFGLLRTELRAVSGNPDLYLRQGAIPTLTHNVDGEAGTLYDRAMLNNRETEYGNWVPIDGRSERRLPPGYWFLAVRANGNSAARYQLRVSSGAMFYLPINGGNYTNQQTFGDDWTYFRVDVPTTVPVKFKVGFSQDYGDVVMHLRDTVPPGNGITTITNEIRDWYDDYKNFGPYLTFDAHGVYTFTAPPIRPGTPLYLGFRGKSQANFSVWIEPNDEPVVEPLVVDFYGGAITTNVQPYSCAVLRVDVPPEASRWRHFSTHETNLVVYMDQGTVPSSAHHRWRSAGLNITNSTANFAFQLWHAGTKQYVYTNYPWVTDVPYFVMVTNNSSIAQDFTFVMEGRNTFWQGENAHPDDNDGNTFPDAWELIYFGKLGQSPTMDTDADGVDNMSEFLEGTDPASAAAFQARIIPLCYNGTIDVSPNLPSYPLGAVVTLTAFPDPEFSFVGWAGATNGLENPLTVVVDRHMEIQAIFKGAGDDWISAFDLYGPYASVQATNVGFSKEAGEPNHAGNPGGKSIWWRWTAPASGTASVSTRGSTFKTLLAVYTGSDVASLVPVCSDYNTLGGTNRSNVSFNAQAGETYSIAVDGYDGASARISLALSMSGGSAPATIGALSRAANGAVHLTLSGAENQAYVVEYSENLVHWYPLGTVTLSGDGEANYTDVTASLSSGRFYRLRRE